MKFVRFAESPAKQNLAAYEVPEASLPLSAPNAVSPTQTHVIFVTTKQIPPGAELKVAYSLTYSRAIGCPVWQNAPQTDWEIVDDNHIALSDSPDSSSIFFLLVGPHLQPSLVQCTATGASDEPHPDSVRNVKKRRRRHGDYRPRSASVENGVLVTDKENHTGPAFMNSDVSAQKRIKRSDESMDMPNFLPPDDDPVENLPEDAPGVICGLSDELSDVAFGPEVSLECGYESNHGIEEEKCELKALSDNYGASQDTEAALQQCPVNMSDTLMERMDSLKSKAHLGLHKTGVCLVCGERVENLPDHLDTKHTDEDIQAVDDACFICYRKFKNRSTVSHHFKLVHRAAAIVPDAASQAAALEFMCRTGFLNYRCSECRVVFPSKKLLDVHSFEHNSDHTNQQQRRCSECPFLATSFAALVDHTSQHALPAKLKHYPCLLCGVAARTGARIYMYRNHPEAMKLITEAWAFQCPECREKFAENFDLNSHVWAAHKGWQCVYCGYRGPRGWLAFDEHITTHQMDNFVSLPGL
ncbi:zinc finger protein 436-like [Paramacrobiotus metropolitanus]|uniref:zinc finger protein 436-like n=1 Tax=Paramacrobiotus metropolitanus TaxID=2943436 RepID=UPI0024459351|nr:zinc finger protein 436-like [Paramacrobiotus metropolitanus]XP_055350890.1 zinc finger protein 436-like [Paramacrobiotus metropolitanus]